MIPLCSEDESNYQAGMTSVVKVMIGSHLRRTRAQRASRKQEHAGRCAIAHCVDQAHAQGLSLRQVAEVLDTSERTLRDWRRTARQVDAPEQAVKSRGRPVLACPVSARNEVIHFLHHVTGPAIGLPALRALFPRVPRCVLEPLLVRYRRVGRRRYCPFGFRLTWHLPGSVWAMDFSDAPFLIDQQYKDIFSVRDLASGFQLAWRRDTRRARPPRGVNEQQQKPRRCQHSPREMIQCY